jgi:hypothetical protein
MGLPMTIRGGGDPTSRHGFQAALKNGPAAPELAADAYDCIMVRPLRGSTEYKAVARDKRNTHGELASDFVVPRHTRRSTCASPPRPSAKP